jgi:DNA-binding NtrC family response regulator
MLRALASVMVLDDDDDMRECLADVLMQAGAPRCVGIGSVAELLARADEALASDLAILDINLGIGQPSGLEAFQWLRKRGYQGRVVFLTGHARFHPLVRRACELPDVQVLEKPIGIDQLERLLRLQ